MTKNNLKFKKQDQRRGGIAIHSDLNRKIFNILVMGIAFLALFYVSVLGRMVFNIVERKSLESEARTLASEVNDLEVVYLSASEEINLEFSNSLGFKEAFPKYATRKSLGSLGLLRNEI